MPRPARTTPWCERRDNGGVFYAHWYDDVTRKTQRLSLRTSDADEAQSRFAEFLLNGKEIRNARPKGAITVARALDDYLKEHARKKCADAERQEHAVAHLKAFFGDRLLSDVDVPTSQGYTAARQAGEIGGGKRRTVKAGATATIRRELNVLVAAANHAIWMGRHTKPIQVDLPPERRLGPDDEAPYYSTEERDAIFAAADGEMAQFVQLLYYTGARRKSIEDLTRDQIKLPQKRIILQQAGKKTTKKRQPIVPILKTMEPLVEGLLETGGKQRVFVSSNFYRQYVALCERLEIDENRRHPHIMRHTRATHLLQEGKSLYDVARLLGDTVATVERVYGHHSHEHLASRLED
ncbi:tyrosine-type recombinase/integrase [Mesorhizobium sp. M0139]|uniref:tyrosine-type recombinase/integrase n=1 Tax=Mesorhizobium sp. M0139 TaxID=2956892 RepID=UPI00333A1E04